MAFLIGGGKPANLLQHWTDLLPQWRS